MASDPELTFGTWLKEYRKAHALTRAELGRRVGCSPETIHKIETGERRPSRQIAELLADNLQVVPERRAAFIEFARTGSNSAHETHDGNTEKEVDKGKEDRGLAADLVLKDLSYSPPTNLRSPLTRLIGRQKELRDIRDYVLRGTRLLTLTGPPGIGKTRLAIQAGLDLLLLFPHGVFFVPLAPARHANAAVEAILSTLGIAEGGEEPLQSLSEYLQDRKLVLLLDNFEQVVEAGPLVVELLESCPGIRVIITSREPLNARGEQRYIVPPLGIPDPPYVYTAESLAEHPAVALFSERAAAVRPGFALTGENAAAVAAICAGAEGVPLSIELLAAHVKMLSPEDLLQRMTRDQGQQQLQLLSGGPVDLPDRHRSLRSAIDWSYDLLSEEERKVFARFSIFAGGCTLGGAEAVCDAAGDLGEGAYGVIGSLLDKNLIKEEAGPAGRCERRFTMLESIRHYAEERLLASGESDVVGQWHAEFFLALAETADPQLAGADQQIWFSSLECDHENLRAALQWTLEHEKAEMAGRLARSLIIFWDVHGHVTEGRRWLESVLERFDDQLPTLLRADMLKGAGSLAEAQGDLARAADLLTQSLEIRREVGDVHGLARSLTNLSLVYMDQGDFEKAHDLLEESVRVHSNLDDRSGLAGALSNLGLVELYRQKFSRAVALFERSLALRREIEDRLGCATALCNLAEAARQQGDYRRARDLIAKALDLARGLDHKELILVSIGSLATIAVDLGQPLLAARIFGAEEALREVLAIPLPAADLEEYTRYVDTARAVAGEVAFAQEWQQGRVMNLEQALVYALSRD